MNIKSLKQIFKENLGFVVYLFIVNSYVIMNLYGLKIEKQFKEVSGLNIDGSDFSGIANLFVTSLNGFMYLLTFVLNFVVTFILVLVSGIVFSRLYFKITSVEIQKRIKDIRIITLLFSCFAVFLIILINRNLMFIFGMLYYLPLVLLTFLLSKSKIKKLYLKQKNENII